MGHDYGPDSSNVEDSEGEAPIYLDYNGTGFLMSDEMEVELAQQLQEAKRYVYLRAVPFLLAVCVLTFLANIYILISARFIKVTLNSTLRLTLSLAVADAWAAVISATGLVMNSYLPFVLSTDEFLGWKERICWIVTVEALRLGGLLTTILHLFTLAINHYLATEFPHTYSKVLTPHKVNTLIGLIWVLPSSGYFVLFSSMPGQAYQSENCENNRWIEEALFRAAHLVMVLIPLLIMIGFYIRIIRILSAMSSQFKRSTGQRCSTVRRKLRTTITALLILGSFIFGWTPSTVFFYLTCTTCPYPYKVMQSRHFAVLIAGGILTNFLMIFKCFLNPIIYAIRIPEIKAALWVMHRTKCGIIKVQGIYAQTRELFPLTQSSGSMYCNSSIHSRSPSMRRVTPPSCASTNTSASSQTSTSQKPRRKFKWTLREQILRTKAPLPLVVVSSCD